MTSPGRPSRSLTRVGAWLLALLAAVGLLVFSAGTASAHTLPEAGNRVRACAPETITAVGVAEHVRADQSRGPPLSQPQIVVATGVAAESATEGTDYLYRGVWPTHDGYEAALRGMRFPAAGPAVRLPPNTMREF